MTPDMNDLVGAGPDEAIARVRRAMLLQLQQIEVLMARVLVVTFAAIVVYAIAAGTGFATGLRVLSVLVCLLLAVAAGGGILGFLFGIPRQLQQGKQTAAAAAPGTAMASQGTATSDATGNGGEVRAVAASSRLYGNNTNLEEISDWITKIIVGIGLIQSTTIIRKVSEASQNFRANAMHEAAGADVVFILVLIVGAIAGFLFFFLETRTRIAVLFVDTDAAVDPSSQREQKQAIQAAANAQIADITGRGSLPGRAVSRERIPADEVILNKRYEDLDTAEEYAAWGSAQARAGNLQPAIRALNEAIAKQPDNKDLLKKLAEVQALQGNWRASYTLFSEVRASQPDGDDPELLKNELVASLYLGPPESFQKALPLIDKLLANPVTEKDAFVQLWAAAAQGQRYDWLPPDNPQRDAARSAALSAAKRVVELAPDPEAPARSLLRQIFDPDREGSSQEENDLEVFKKDPDFRAVIYPGESQAGKGPAG